MKDEDYLPGFDSYVPTYRLEPGATRVRAECFGKTIKLAYFERNSSERVSFFDQNGLYHTSVSVRYSK